MAGHGGKVQAVLPALEDFLLTDERKQTFQLGLDKSKYEVTLNAVYASSVHLQMSLWLKAAISLCPIAITVIKWLKNGALDIKKPKS